jgi:hypothetical protein
VEEVFKSSGEEYRRVSVDGSAVVLESYKEYAGFVHESSSSFSGPQLNSSSHIPRHSTSQLQRFSSDPSRNSIMVAYTSLVLLGASVAVANPLFPRQNGAATVTVTAQAPASTAWNAGAVNEYPIHASCNATQRAYLKKGLAETATICRQARDHILRWGNESSIYQKYFGDAPTGEPLGWFSKLADGDKSGVLFRCDDIDNNCRQSGTYRLIRKKEPVLTLNRMGRPLAWFQCHFRDSHLRLVV